MLSDEEKKMLEIFKKEVEKEQNEYEQVNEYTKFCYNNHKFILNLIEKQSKEIEDNKKYIDLHYVPYEQYISKLNGLNKKWEDKIKAKIEPRLKELDEKMEKEWKEYGNSREYQDMEDEWNFLQSLLEEKE